MRKLLAIGAAALMIGGVAACGAGNAVQTDGKHVLDASKNVVFVTDKAICDFLPQNR